MTERRYRLAYSATIVVEVDAESPEDAQCYARADVIDQLCGGDMVRREIWVTDVSVNSATVTLDNQSPSVDEVTE